MPWRADGKVRQTEIPLWRNVDDNHCTMSGRITIADNGSYNGKVSIRSGGLFVSSESLRSADGQRARAEALVRRVLPQANLGGVTVKQLTPTAFDADVDIMASGPLEKFE